jgi:hypothetical protein
VGAQCSINAGFDRSTRDRRALVSWSRRVQCQKCPAHASKHILVAGIESVLFLPLFPHERENYFESSLFYFGFENALQDELLERRRLWRLKRPQGPTPERRDTLIVDAMQCDGGLCSI